MTMVMVLSRAEVEPAALLGDGVHEESKEPIRWQLWR